MKKLLLIFACTLLLCCGTRKTETNTNYHENNSELKQRTQLTAIGQNNAGTTITKQADITTQGRIRKQNLNLRPADPSKPMRVTDPDGKTTTYENAILESQAEDAQQLENRKESRTQKDTSASTNKTKLQVDLNKKTGEKSGGKSKKTERSIVQLIGFYLVLIIVVLILWQLYKKWQQSRLKSQNPGTI